MEVEGWTDLCDFQPDVLVHFLESNSPRPSGSEAILSLVKSALKNLDSEFKDGCIFEILFYLFNSFFRNLGILFQLQFTREMQILI